MIEFGEQIHCSTLEEATSKYGFSARFLPNCLAALWLWGQRREPGCQFWCCLFDCVWASYLNSVSNGKNNSSLLFGLGSEIKAAYLIIWQIKKFSLLPTNIPVFTEYWIIAGAVSREVISISGVGWKLVLYTCSVFRFQLLFDLLLFQFSLGKVAASSLLGRYRCWSSGHSNGKHWNWETRVLVQLVGQLLCMQPIQV